MKMFLIFLASWLLQSAVLADDFFSIQKLEVHLKPPKDGIGTYNGKKKYTKEDKNLVFIPCVEAQVKTRQQTKANGLFARLYFYNAKGEMLDAVKTPAVAQREMDEYAMPVFFKKAESERLFFVIPGKLCSSTDWKALAVFGDEQAAAVKIYPTGPVASYEYPEKKIVESNGQKMVERKADMDPVVEYVVKTSNPKQPQITLFLRPPVGIKDGSQVKGVLAMCILANNVGEIRRKLQGLEASEEIKGLIGFAERHQFAILCWGSNNLWDPRKSSDEQSKAVNREMDESFDDVAKAWDCGVEELSQRYGIPNRNFLLWGSSGSAQWAHRLALRKPDRFLAVHVHIPSSFDQPTAKANKVLWLLTTGELEGGYERAMRFYVQCRSLGYPMIFKAIIGLGHSGSPIADNLGEIFFEYALSLREQRAQLDKQRNDSFAKLKQSEADESFVVFKSPAFWGDLVNQGYFPAAQVEIIPKAFRVPLPTKVLAIAWDREK